MAAPSRVLIVEDDPLVQSLVAEVFLNEACDVRTAGDGGEAIRQLEAWTPDVIILDLILPSMSGAELRRRIKETAPHIPIIVMSAYLDLIGDEPQIVDAVAKPFDVDDLVAAVFRALNR